MLVATLCICTTCSNIKSLFYTLHFFSYGSAIIYCSAKQNWKVGLSKAGVLCSLCVLN